jgi:hypothetical protein
LREGHDLQINGAAALITHRQHGLEQHLDTSAAASQQNGRHRRNSL